MPEDCDIPQLVKYPSLSLTTKDEDDEDSNELNVTTNPQSKVTRKDEEKKPKESLFAKPAEK